MSHLGPEDRALIERTRRGHEPCEEDRDRVRLALLARLGAGTGLAGPGGAVLAKAQATLALAKGLAVVAVVAVVGGIGTAVYRDSHAVPQPLARSGDAPAVVRRAFTPVPGAHPLEQIASPLASMTHASAAPAVPAVNPSPVLAAPAVSPPASVVVAVSVAPFTATHGKTAVAVGPGAGHTLSSLPSRTAAPEGELSASEEIPANVMDTMQPAPAMPARALAPALPVSSPVGTPSGTLGAETRLVRAALAAVHAGDAVRALELLDEHDRRFPDGALAEECGAERVAALCDLRRDAEARAAALSFVRTHPTSPLVGRVTSGCGATRNP